MSDAIEKLRALAEAATPGPWRWGKHDPDRGYDIERMTLYPVRDDRENGVGFPIIWLREDSATVTAMANSDFIAACSPDALVALLDRLEAAERERDEAREDSERWHRLCDIESERVVKRTAERDTLRAQLAACQAERDEARAGRCAACKLERETMESTVSDACAAAEKETIKHIVARLDEEAQRWISDEGREAIAAMAALLRKEQP